MKLSLIGTEGYIDEINLTAESIFEQMTRAAVRAPKSVNMLHGGRFICDKEARHRMDEEIKNDPCVLIPQETAKRFEENYRGIPIEIYDDET